MKYTFRMHYRGYVVVTVEAPDNATAESLAWDKAEEKVAVNPISWNICELIYKDESLTDNSVKQ